MLDMDITDFWDVTSCNTVGANLSATPVASVSSPVDFRDVPLSRR